MVSLRYKPLKNGQFSVYLDIYFKDDTGKKQRKYEFLEYRGTKDYSEETSRVKEADREVLAIAKEVRARKELEVLKGTYGTTQTAPSLQADLLAFVQNEVKRKRTNVGYNLALLAMMKNYLDNRRLTFIEVNSDWCESFKHYMLARVSSNTTRAYLQTLSLFLRIVIEA